VINPSQLNFRSCLIPSFPKPRHPSSQRSSIAQIVYPTLRSLLPVFLLTIPSALNEIEASAALFGKSPQVIKSRARLGPVNLLFCWRNTSSGFHKH